MTKRDASGQRHQRRWDDREANQYKTLTRERAVLGDALQANEERYRRGEIDLAEYQAGIDKARHLFRVATGEATDWKAVAHDMFDYAADYADSSEYAALRRAWERSIADHTERD